jgi:hypothetical protein
MAESEKSQTMNFSADRCFECLLRVFPHLQINVRKSDETSRTVEGFWTSSAGAQFVVRASCSLTSENSTNVVLGYNSEWASIFSRPVAIGRGAKLVQEQVNEKMDAIFSDLVRYLPNLEALPKPEPVQRVQMDMPAVMLGGFTSLGARVLASVLTPGLYQAYHWNLQDEANFTRAISIVGVFIGALVAGLVKRREPVLGNAMLEGVMVGLVNVWFSIIACKTFFSIDWQDWIVYGVVGAIGGALGTLGSSMARRSRPNGEGEAKTED